MADRIMLQVTSPHHGAAGEVIHGPGDLLEPGTDLPQGLTVTKVIVDAPDKPAKAGPEPEPARPAAAKQPSGKGA